MVSWHSRSSEAWRRNCSRAIHRSPATAGGDMDAVLGDYVAEKVIDDFRADRQFSESVLRSIRVFPLIDQIRSRIDPRDSERVLSLLRSPSITVFRFGLSLARRIQHLPEIRDALQRSWGSSRDPQIREAVIWALTQYPETTRAEHAAFFEFFRENPAVFLDELETWFGGR